MAFRETTALHKILALKQRVRGVAGGTSASKTISILMWLIDYCQSHENQIVSVVSESFPHLKRGCIRDFLTIMIEQGYFKDGAWNKTDYIYTFETGSKIEFFSADQPGKVRGPRRDVLFLNEANNVSYETYTQLEIRTRKVIWLDHNPVAEYWFYTEVMHKDNVDFLVLTYKDNEALEKSIIESIESRRDNKNWWKVYGLGELGDNEGKIYSGWKIVDNVPHEARLERRGLDFGYTNDPSAVVSVYYYNGGYILDEELYRKGMSNREIGVFLNNLERPATLVIADSAEPKSIDEIRNYDVPIIGANKGPGSITQGIQRVQDQRISMTKRSVNLIREYRNYMWQTDKEGLIINVPMDLFNHCLDPVRYVFENLMSKEEADDEITTGNIDSLIY